jgi:hypothetical protein
MAVLTYTEIEALMLDDLQANVTTDPPVTTGVANQAGRFINDAYAQIWELSGGRLRKAPSANAWTAAQLCTGTCQGILTDVGDVLHLFGTTTAPASISCTTAASVTITSAALFGSVVAGMHVSGTGISANTYVVSKTDASTITINQVATDSTTTARTFSPTESTNELRRAELSEIQWLRSNSTVGTYVTPKKFALVYHASPGGTDVNKLILEYWPSTTGYYFPIHYTPQFVPLDSTITTPDANDLESRDIGHLAAFNLATLNGRSELATACAFKLSENTRLGLDRKIAAMLQSKQDA